jgi:tetratricopeptide (TPR) repeat protein
LTPHTVEARALLERAHAAFQAEGETRAAARVSARLAEIDFNEGHPQQAVARLEPALEALRGGVADADVAALAAQLGRFLVFAGQEDRAAPHLEQALGLAEALDLPETLAQALNSKAILLLRHDRLFEARTLLEGALSLARAHDLHAAALRTYNNLGVVLGSADRLADGYAVAERAIEHARRVGDRNWEGNFVAGAVGWLFSLGRWDEALVRFAEAEELASTSFAQGLLLAGVSIHCERGELEQARELLARLAAFAQSEDTTTAAIYAIQEAQLLRAEGKPKDALAAAERALATRQELGATFFAFKNGLVEALEAALALGDTAKARELLSSIDPLRPGELTPLLKAQQARFRARLAATDGETDADAGFASAEGLFRELETPFWLAVTRLEHAEWLVSQGRAEDAEPLLAQARETFA